MLKFSQKLFSPSVLFLILTNLSPIVGVLFWDWDVFTVIILYWLESAAVGFFNILKMEKINNYTFSPAIPLFIVHYTIFMFVHLFFILRFFKPDLGSASEQWEAFKIVFNYLEGLLISCSFLFLSHGLSFIFNFIKKEEYKNISLIKQMFVPYQRIIIMQIMILLIGSGIFYYGYGRNFSAIVFLVILKIIFDGASHLWEHNKNIEA